MKAKTGNDKLSVNDFFKKLSENDSFIMAVAYTNLFKKNVKQCFKQGLELADLYDVVEKIAKQEPLLPKNKLHQLTGYIRLKETEKCMECHIFPDWLLVWVQDDSKLILVLTNTGSHSELF